MPRVRKAPPNRGMGEDPAATRLFTRIQPHFNFAQSHMGPANVENSMCIRAYIFALAVALACCCATQHFTKKQGNVGQFILQLVIRYGGQPTTTNELPSIMSHWSYLEDDNGTQIHLPPNSYSDVEVFLNQAFAGKRQFGPNASADGRTRIHEYRMSEKGGGVQLTEHGSETLVLVLRPFGVSK